MFTISNIELNPYEQAINLCKEKVKDFTASKRSDLAKAWSEELDKWIKSYKQFRSVVHS